MSLRSWIISLGSVTPKSADVTANVTEKPNEINGVTHVTRVTRKKINVGEKSKNDLLFFPSDDASNAEKPNEINGVATEDQKKVKAEAKLEPDLLFLPASAINDWVAAAQAYNSHHFGCLVCIAAGRGARYGTRCAVGLPLWNNYTEVQ